jgi:hypothetical protein
MKISRTSHDKKCKGCRCKKCKGKNIIVYSWAMITVSHRYTCLDCGHVWNINDGY